jgi:hypothetical protein
MKIKVTRRFRVEFTTHGPTHVLEVGEYEVPKDCSRQLADEAIRFGFAEKVRGGKVAPENKLGKAADSKKKVGRKAVRSGGAGAKSDGADSQEG